MPHTIINYTNEHSWAVFKSTIFSSIQLRNSHLYKSAANQVQREELQTKQ